MQDGTYCYAIEMQAPLGARPGGLRLQLERESLSGTLTLFRRTAPVQGRCTGDGRAELRGTLYTLISAVEFKAVGRLTETELTMDFITARGTFRTTGISE